MAISAFEEKKLKIAALLPQIKILCEKDHVALIDEKKRDINRTIFTRYFLPETVGNRLRLWVFCFNFFIIYVTSALWG